MVLASEEDPGLLCNSFSLCEEGVFQLGLRSTFGNNKTKLWKTFE